MRVLAPGAYSVSARAATRSSKPPASTKRRDVNTVRSCAVRMAEDSARLPAEKFSTAAIRDVGEPAPQHQAGEDHPPVGQRIAVSVLEDDCIDAVSAGGFDEAGK